MKKNKDRTKDATMKSVTIPPHGWRRRRCGYIMIGPAYTAINAEGYLWRCPGCALRAQKARPG